MKRIILWGLLIVVTSSVTGAADPAPVEFTFSKLKNEKDTAKAQVADGKVMFIVMCPRGIGECTVTAKKGEWPDQVTLLLDDFQELEDFQFSIGRMRAHGSRKESGRFTLFFLGDDRDFNKRSEVGTLAVKVEQRKEGVAVVFPGKLFADAESVYFGWIDWLR